MLREVIYPLRPMGRGLKRQQRGLEGGDVRWCALQVLAPATHAELETLYQRLNPLQLRRDLEAALDRLWTLAAPDPHRAPGNTEIATPSLKSAPGGS